jgi:hypothetical protein
MNKLLQYTSPAAYIFETDKTYSLDILENEYKLSVDFIKELFTPINFSWSDIDVNPETPIVPVENVVSVESMDNVVMTNPMGIEEENQN